MKRALSVCLFLSVLPFLVAAQAPAGKPKLPSNVSVGNIDSKLMSRSMPYRIILPSGYSASKQKRYPVIYLLHGLFGSSENWTTLTKLPAYAKSYEFIIINPEGGDGWYTDSPTKQDDRYESYIVKELIPEIDAKYRTDASRNGRVIAGLSMGGYGALKFGVKYPAMFSLAGSFSGALGAASYRSTPAFAPLLGSLGEAFGPAGSETRKKTTCSLLSATLRPNK